MDTYQPPCRLRRREASTYLKQIHNVDRSPRTLAKLAVVGGGPAFKKFGRAVFYEPEALDQWVESILSGPFVSTSQDNDR